MLWNLLLNEKRKKTEKLLNQTKGLSFVCLPSNSIISSTRRKTFLLDLCSLVSRGNLNANFPRKWRFSSFSSFFRSPQILQAKVQFKKDIERVQRRIKGIPFHYSWWILTLLCAAQMALYPPWENFHSSLLNSVEDTYRSCLVRKIIQQKTLVANVCSFN